MKAAAICASTLAIAACGSVARAPVSSETANATGGVDGANPSVPAASGPVQNVIRVYDPVSRAFSEREGTLRCAHVSVSGWEHSATAYQREVRASIEALRSAFTAYYDAALRRDISTSGTSCVGFVIDLDGSVITTEVASGTLPRSLLDCVLLSAASVHVPPASTRQQVFLPLTFVTQ